MDLGQGARDGADVILDGAARGWDQGKHHGGTPLVRVPVVVNGAASFGLSIWELSLKVTRLVVMPRYIPGKELS